MTSTKTPKASRVIEWPTLTVAALTAHTAVTDADPAMVESIQQGGIKEPLYVATLGDGTYRVVDGLRRLAAAQAAALTDVPVTYRPVIRTDALSKHPNNVRRQLKITREFRNSIREHGVRTAILVRRTAAGLEVVDGHRRLLGAIAEGLTHVPYTYDEVSDSAAYLDMVTTAEHRAPLTTAEQAAALFEAAELGATAKQMAAAAGKTQKDVKTLVRAGGSRTVAKVAAADLTLTDLDRLAQLEIEAPDLAEEIEAAINKAPQDNHAWRINDALSTAAARRDAAAHRAELEAAGAQFRRLSELSPKAAPVHQLTITPEDHATCPGQVYVLTHESNARYTRYCTNTTLYGHLSALGPTKISPAERKRVITGNGHWDGATQARHEWLAALIGRASHPKKITDVMNRITAQVVLGADSVVQTKQTHPRRTELLGQWLGLGEDAAKADLASKASARRAAVQTFAAIAACYELYAPRTAWRTDDRHDRSQAREHTARYLTWLTELGYKPSPIETAVIDGTEYDPAAQTAATPDAAEDTPDTLDD